MQVADVPLVPPYPGWIPKIRINRSSLDQPPARPMDGVSDRQLTRGQSGSLSPTCPLAPNSLGSHFYRGGISAASLTHSPQPCDVDAGSKDGVVWWGLKGWDNPALSHCGSRGALEVHADATLASHNSCVPHGWHGHKRPAPTQPWVLRCLPARKAPHSARAFSMWVRTRLNPARPSNPALGIGSPQCTSSHIPWCCAVWLFLSALPRSVQDINAEFLPSPQYTCCPQSIHTHPRLLFLEGIFYKLHSTPYYR